MTQHFRVETLNKRHVLCGGIVPVTFLKRGQRWASADGSDREVEIVNIMESEDMGTIKAKINELKARDPGAFGAEPMIVEVKEAAGAAEEMTGEVQPLSGELALIHARMKIIERMVTDIGYRNKFAAGVYSGKVEGVMIGLIVSFVILGFILLG